MGKPIIPTLDAVVYISRGMNMALDEFLKMLDDKQKFYLKEDSLSFNDNSAVVLVYRNIPNGIPIEMI